TRAVHFAGRRMRSNDLVRSSPFLDPLVEGAFEVHLVRSFTAAAVAHPGRQEQTDGIRSLLLAAERIQHALVVLNRGQWRDVRIGPAVVQKQLSLAREERREI